MIDWTIEVLRQTLAIWLEMSPYVVLGLVAAIIVFAFFPKDRVHRFLGRPGWRSIVKAGMAGVPLPLCSCGVLPTALSLRKQGASRGATVSFLVSTPETGLDSMAVTYALINPLMTVLRPVAAFLSAVLTGLAVERFAPESEGSQSTGAGCAVCGDDSCATTHTWSARLNASARYVVFDFLPDIAGWLVLGVILSGVIGASVPAGLFGSTSALVEIALVVTAGIPMYICASASTPIAAVLLAKGMSPGAVLVFLLVGPATNIASLLVVGRALGSRTATVYLTGLIAVSVAIGLTVNGLCGGLDWTPAIAAHSGKESVSLIHWGGAAILICALLGIWVRQALRRSRQELVRADSAIHD